VLFWTLAILPAPENPPANPWCDQNHPKHASWSGLDDHAVGGNEAVRADQVPVEDRAGIGQESHFGVGKEGTGDHDIAVHIEALLKVGNVQNHDVATKRNSTGVDAGKASKTLAMIS
jgi:hypothetical protein